jgi:exonuclease III
MRAGFWNIRGYHAPGCQPQIRDLLAREHLDIVGLQETIKRDFSQADLRSIDPQGKFAWHSLPALGHSGGILVGVNEDTFEAIAWTEGRFFLRVDILQLATNTTWTVFVVYGPADHRLSDKFLGELSAAVNACPFPLAVGGDFNLIRGSEDKSNDNIHWPRVHKFNDCIADLALREIRRGGARYTWTNKQLNPVRSVLDRMLVSTDWEMLFPLCTLTGPTIIGSDHAPLILDSGEDARRRSPRFYFEKGWLERADFGDLVTTKWHSLEGLGGPFFDPIDAWQHVSGGLRQFLKGWGANVGKADRDLKENILGRI